MFLTELISLELPNWVREKIDLFHGINLRCLKNQKFLWENKIFFEILIKPDHPFSKPLLGEIQGTSNFLLKIRKKRETNLIKNGKIFIKIDKTIKIRNFADFLYLPFCENLISKSIKPRQEVGKILKKLSLKNQFKQSFPVDFLLPLNPGFLKYRENFVLEEKEERERKKKKKFKSRNSFFYEPITPIGIDQRSFVETSIDSNFLFDFREKGNLSISTQGIKKVLKMVPNFVLGFFLKLFKKRPIWNYKTIKKYCQPFLRRYIKKTLPLISYLFREPGIFKDSWIRFNFNPRGNPTCLIYRPTGLDDKKILIPRSAGSILWLLPRSENGFL